MSSGRRASHEDPPVPADQLLRDANGQPISAAEHEQHPRPSAWERVNETWTLEVLGFVLAALCLVGTVVLLRVFDGQRVPDWPVTLNFVLSLLANVAFAATMLGVQSSLGQLKWLRFAGGPRPLAEIAAFQGARSPLGALRLTLAAGFSPVALGMALAILLGAFWGPFTQNLVQYQDGNVTVDAEPALLARSAIFSATGLTENSSQNYIDPKFLFDMQSAFINVPSTEFGVPKFACSTGNCTWDPVATLGFCEQCADVSSHVVLNCTRDDGEGQACEASLPNDSCRVRYMTQSANCFINMTRVPREQALVFRNASGPIFHALRLPPPYPLVGNSIRVTQANFTATECSLNPCVRSFVPTVYKGRYSERPLATWIAPPAGRGTEWGYYCPESLTPPWGPELGVTTPGQQFGCGRQVREDWRVADGGGGGETPYPSRVITGYVCLKDRTLGRTFAGELAEYMYRAAFPSDAACSRLNADTFACAAATVANAMTLTMRNAAFLVNGTSAADLAVGRTHTAATFVRIVWAWIALPVAVWLLGLATWAAVAAQTRRRRLPTWRDNQLPLAFVYREGGGLSSLRGGGNSNAAYQHLAEKTSVGLAMDGEGVWRLAKPRKTL